VGRRERERQHTVEVNGQWSAMALCLHGECAVAVAAMYPGVLLLDPAGAPVTTNTKLFAVAAHIAAALVQAASAQSPVRTDGFLQRGARLVAPGEDEAGRGRGL
jgi:hypothetical protein